MFSSINKPASCEIPAVMQFLHADKMSVTEIRRELFAVRGQNIMREGAVRQWCRVFKDGQANRCSR
jgi:hypothetical protein